MQINGRNALPSTDATLSDLVIEGRTGGESITLSPAFDEDTLTYTATVSPQHRRRHAERDEEPQRRHGGHHGR